mgnify:CR=1 FL=1
MSPDVLLDLIQAHPQAFGLMDRYSMDYAEALINAGVIVLTNKWGENAKKAFIDATRKNAFINIDLSVIALIAGVFIFLLGNSYISGCGIILFFGALLNLAIQFIVNGSGLYFLSTSHYGLNNRGLITSKFVNKAKEAEKREKEEKKKS